MTEPWRIEMLGWLRAVQGERVVSRFRTQKTGALLAYLAYHLDRSHPRETLIELLWPEMAPPAGRNNLSKALTSLRHQLEPPGVPTGAVLVTDSASVRLNPTAVTTDVAAFEAALRVAPRAPEEIGRTPRLEEAATLYRGELLPGHNEDWILHERLRLAEAFSGALAELTALWEQADDLQQALQWARRAVGADPLREEAHHDLIRLLIAARQPEAALRQYQELERLLEGGLGMRPSPETRALIGDLARHPAGARCEHPEVARESRGRAGEDLAPARQAAPPSPSPPVGPATGNLPLQFTRFFGREEEIARLQTSLSDPEIRLVTLTGPGGSGKTRLALQTAQCLRDTSPVPAWFVPLVDLKGAGLIADKMLDALRLPRSPNSEPLEQVIAFLARQPSLLVLDNFEHLVQDGAPVVRTLLERVGTLTCLVTSRQCLNLAGEREFPVAPLGVPGVQDTVAPTPEHLLQFSSVELFVDRAQAVRADFQVTEANAASIAALCRQLEGLPLAIELAASRARMLSVKQMLDRFERRFELLVGRKRLADPRHQSLQATLDWSYALLPPEVQRFFVQLAVFRGGWTLEAAEAVCEALPGNGPGNHEVVRARPRLRTGRTLEYLEQLRECSLVIVGERDQEVRYRLQETLRDYGAEQLDPGERAALEQRHAAYFLGMAEQAEAGLWSAERTRWLEYLDDEYDNLRWVLAWSQMEPVSAADMRMRAAVGLRLAGALSWFWFFRSSLREGRQWLDRALGGMDAPAAGTAPPLAAARAKALNGAGALALHAADYGAARSLCAASLALWEQEDDPRGAAWSLCHLGWIAIYEGDYHAASGLATRSLEICRQLGDRWGFAPALLCLGSAVRELGELEQARLLLEESRQIAGELGDNYDLAWSLCNLGLLAQIRGDLGIAETFLAESLEVFRKLGHLWSAGQLLGALGKLALQQNDAGAARRFFKEALEIHRVLGNQQGLDAALQYLEQSA
jgi:predicted ATPase